MMNDTKKWNQYYEAAHTTPPPWESTRPYHGLISFLEDIHIRSILGIDGYCGGGIGGSFSSSVLGGRDYVQNVVKKHGQRQLNDENAQRAFRPGGFVCELGAGCSASALYLAELGFQTTAVDISPLARERFYQIYGNESATCRINYIVADILNIDGLGSFHEQLLNTLPEHTYIDELDSKLYHRRCEPFANTTTIDSCSVVPSLFQSSVDTGCDSESAGSVSSPSGSSTSNYSTQFLKKKHSLRQGVWPLLGNRQTETGSIATVSSQSVGSGGYRNASKALLSSSDEVAEKASKWRATHEPHGNGFDYNVTEAFESAKRKNAKTQGKVFQEDLNSPKAFGKEVLPIDPLCLESNSSLRMQTETRNRGGVFPIDPLCLESNPSLLMQAETPGLFSFVFDMQCFHVLRDVDEEKAVDETIRLLKPGGYLMIVAGANPRHSERTLDDIHAMKRRKRERAERAILRVQKREDEHKKAAQIAEDLEWEKTHGAKKDKYSNIRVKRSILENFDAEVQKQVKIENTGMQDRISFINDREEYFKLSQEGYAKKDEQEKYDRQNEEQIAALITLENSLEAHYDAASEQAFASQDSMSIPGELGCTESYFDANSSLASNSAFEVSSFDPTIIPSKPLIRIQSMKSYETDDMINDGRHLKSDQVSFRDPLRVNDKESVPINETLHHSQSRGFLKTLPDDMSSSTEYSSFPSLGSNNESLGEVSEKMVSYSPEIKSWTSGKKNKSGKSFLKSSYYLTGGDPPRPFSPPSFAIPNTDGVNWGREESAYDIMMSTKKDQKSPQGIQKRIIDDKSMESRVNFPSIQKKNKKIPKATSGPPRLYRAEVITPFVEHKRTPLVLEYCRLTTFNSTPASLNTTGIPDSGDDDSDEEIWSEMGYKSTNVNPEGTVEVAPLCWEALFRRETQEEILKDIV